MKDETMIILARTTIAIVLLLALMLFGTIIGARAHEAMVLLGDDSKPAYYTFINTPMTCLQLLERHEVNRESGTWLSWQFEGQKERQRIWNVICILGEARQNPPLPRPRPEEAP
jgi:hypothetical protein